MNYLRMRWQRANSYDLVERRGQTFLTDMSRELFLVARGPIRAYAVHEVSGCRPRQMMASLMLANMPIDPRAAQSWANQWGLLARGSEQRVDDFFDAATRLQSQCAVVSFGMEFSIPQKYIPSPPTERVVSGGSVERVPDSLFAYCWAEMMNLLVMMKNDGRRFRSCKYCGGWYLPRPRAGHTRYCNHNRNACKNAAESHGIPEGPNETAPHFFDQSSRY